MVNFATVKDLMKHEDDLGKMGYCLEALTCYECGEWNSCPYAFDPYNTYPDCLKDK